MTDATVDECDSGDAEGRKTERTQSRDGWCWNSWRRLRALPPGAQERLTSLGVPLGAERSSA